MIKAKRVYDPLEADDGTRFLVDRLWPRGIKKEDLSIYRWSKEVAPEDSLRRWFGHDTSKWKEFQRLYFAELDSRPEAWRLLLDAAHQGNVTLLYSATDREHNNAVALKAYLEARLKEGSP
ncbi:MAG: DUF488 family protein [Chloroflexi bacterium]|nr:DUF488 family protein [Chloroflexota bacterium]